MSRIHFSNNKQVAKEKNIIKSNVNFERMRHFAEILKNIIIEGKVTEAYNYR